MKPEFYTSPAHFEKEQEKIFRELWIFVGFKMSVKKPNQFLTRDVGGFPIVVQNFDGTLRAFVNSCAHRFARLQTEEFGTRPLSCGYHGWKYNQEGAASFIPMKDKYYKFSECAQSELKLRKVHLKEIGEFLFVNLSEKPISIQQQFNSTTLQEDLLSISRSLDSEFILGKTLHQFNWKLPFENLRDALHPYFVHPRTISQDVNFEGEGFPSEPVHETSVPLERLSFGGAEGEFKKSQKEPFHAFVDRWGSRDAYFNWLLYPNTHIASPDGGYSFIIEHYHPVSPEKTILQNYWILAKKKKAFNTAPVLWASFKAGRRILDEDAEIMELAQAGMNERSPRGVQGLYEAEAKRMEIWYTDHMQGEV